MAALNKERNPLSVRGTILTSKRVEFSFSSMQFALERFSSSEESPRFHDPRRDMLSLGIFLRVLLFVLIIHTTRLSRFRFSRRLHSFEMQIYRNR